MSYDDLDWAAVEAAGLLADADDVEDRKALLRLLAKDGVSVTEMVEAHRAGALMRVVGERTIRPGAGELTLREVAERAGTEVEVVQRILRSLGAISPDPDDRTSSRDDVELVETGLLFLDRFGEDVGWSLLRRYGASVERLTEALSSAAIRAFPNISTSFSGSEAATAAAWTEVAEFVPRLGRLLDLTSRHQIESVRRYFETAGAATQTETSFVLGVGFADLSGYTSTTLLLELSDLGALIADFEARATEAVADFGGRVVKFVGDAVLFVCNDPDDLVRIGQALVAPDVEEGATLRARAGLARGLVLARDGDYFGPTVNLAARLVDGTGPGTVVLDEGLRASLDPDRWVLVTEEPRSLKGIDEPVVAYRLEGEVAT